MKNFLDFLSESFRSTREKNELFDVVIPTHEKDAITLAGCIDGIKKNIIGARRIIVVSKQKLSDQAEWFDEKNFPFSYQEISELVDGKEVGWNFQQLLKLYSALVIPDILPNVLVVDADTVFYRKVRFFEDSLPLYNLSKDQDLDKAQFHQNTSNHIARILPAIAEKLPEIFDAQSTMFRHQTFLDRLKFSRRTRKSEAFGLESGICHHMLFQKKIIEEMFSRIEKHDGGTDPFYKIFLKKARNAFGVAEYNLYFYFLISHHPKSYKIRLLRYKNTTDFNPLKEKLRRKYHYCSYHSYMRQDRKIGLPYPFNKIRNWLFIEQWNIGLIKSPIHEILRCKPEIIWLKNPSLSRFYADPFGFQIGDKNYIIFEDYSKILRRGRIAIAEIDENLQIISNKIVLDDGRHLSYPYVFNDGGSIYVICESYKSQKLSLYEINQEHLVLEKKCDIFSDRAVVDPTMFFHQGKYWLFYTTAKSSNSELFISFSDSLLGSFKPHPKNPVKIDNASSRPAGTIFMADGKIFRPSQNCSKDYGKSIVINYITKLTETEYAEEFVKEIHADCVSQYNIGTHTISSLGDNMTLIDGRRRIFVPYKPLLSIVYKLRKIFLVS